MQMIPQKRKWYTSSIRVKNSLAGWNRIASLPYSVKQNIDTRKNMTQMTKPYLNWLSINIYWLEFH